jgi:hypothetical protein
MQDASDFPTDAAGRPDLVLIFVYVGAALAIWICGFLIGKFAETRRTEADHRRAAEDIHAAVAQWADAVVRVPPNYLPLDYVKALLGEIKGRIGPAQSLASETSKRISTLQDMIEPKPDKAAPKPEKTAAETTILYPALVPAGGPQPDGPAVLTSGFVAQKGPVVETAKAEAPATPMTMEEQQMRMQLEANKFRAWWCGSPGAREDRIRELIAAQKALCHTTPFVRLDFGGQGRAGGRH